MGKFNISVHRVDLATGEALSQDKGTARAVWVKAGALDVGGDKIAQGEGVFVNDTAVIASAESDLVVFRISPEAARSDALLRAAFEWQGSAVLRLDQVSFPPGARAYRHIHPGPGIRYLSAGQLEILSDHDCTMMQVGEAWYEDANSPVQATASDVPTAFVRAMVLPLECLGKPTLKLLNAEDHDKPRLQTNTRFFDQTIDLSDT